MLPGDLYLLCTDGLWGMISDEIIKEKLHDADPERLDEACEALIRVANASGGKDNITVLLAALL